jgi:hypothetical protein
VIDQTGKPLVFDAFFTSAKIGKVGLSVTVDVYNPAGAQVVTAATAAEIGDGIYSYTMSGTLNVAAGNYRAVFKTADGTVDFQHVPSLWTAGQGWVQQLRHVTAGVAGKVSGAGTGTESFFDEAGVLAFVVTCDNLGNRLSVAYS